MMIRCRRHLRMYHSIKTKQLVQILLFLILCSAVTVVYRSFFKMHCYDLTDEAYQPPFHLIQKWVPPQVSRTGLKVADLIYDKFPPRNPAAIAKTLEKFFTSMEPLDTFLSTKKFVSKISTLSTEDNMKSGPYRQLDENYIQNTAFISTREIKLNSIDTEDLILSEYYNSTATNCTDFKNRSNGKFDVQTCSDDPSRATNPKPLQMQHILHSKTFKDLKFYPSVDDDAIPVTYIQVLKNAFVDSDTGDITTETTNTAGEEILTEIVIRRCATYNHDKPTKGRMQYTQVYNQVFTISQFWGKGYFHHMSEQLPRIVPFLKFLRNNPQVFVHVAGVEGFVINSLGLLGIAEHRIISGDIRANILYLPPGGMCGHTPLIQGQMLSLLLRQQIETEPVRRSVILIQRSHKRYFSCHNNIRDMLHKLVSGYGLDLEVFGDSPSPGLEETAEMFNRAIMVVGPHGAGLANMLFCEPGTVIIEGVCSEVNHCFKDSAFVLGHRYAAINYPKKTCKELQAADIEPVVKYFLQTLAIT